MTVRLSMCVFCRHLRRELPGITCDAFPNGIPREIFFGDQEHFLPITGDQGIQFEPIDNCPTGLLGRFREHSLAAAHDHLDRLTGP